MGVEIERKYLVKGDDWKKQGTGQLYQQGYLSTHPDRTVRVRTVGNEGYLTIKGITAGASRSEYEYGIPYADAQSMLDQLCQRPLIQKVRYRITYEGLVWEVDEFQGENQGLVVAEVELTDEHQTIALPDWVGKEVTAEEKYYNANLIKHPYSQWD
ncbi:CYTH domain-containing protein [Spirosoma oryzicola]|uniref:CYTH domain-containing protein n=1 Tax=Spirosoma oryzicola TaxID=2898794 RepID=UPI001E3FB9C0|nr:CYTH domain-containing protein [Spirosoma oryzicola]UHG93807.1 CYTH domain-containing protein [Spirosoma oryzicola]